MNWTSLVFYSHGIFCVYWIIRRTTRNSNPLDYKLLSSIIWLTFILPQVWALIRSNSFDGALLSYILIFSQLCLMSIIYAPESNRSLILVRHYSKQRMIFIFISLFLVGLVGRVGVLRLGATYGDNLYSGSIVAMNFFRKFLIYCLPIGAWLIINKSKYKWLISILCLLILFDYSWIALAGGRKGTAIEIVIAFISMYTIQFRRKFKPRLMLLVALIGGITLYSTAEYRGKVQNNNEGILTTLTSLSIAENFQNVLVEGDEEIYNMALLIKAYKLTGSYDFGTYNWDRLIWNYVPAQIVGKEIKSSLMFERDDVLEIDSRFWEYDKSTGSTATGLADSFGSFGIFGFIKFAIISILMSQFYNKLKFADPFALLVYNSALVGALHSITHNTQWFFSNCLLALVVVGLSRRITEIRFK